MADLTRTQAAQFLAFIATNSNVSFWPVGGQQQLNARDLEKYVHDLEDRADALAAGIARMVQGRPLLPPADPDPK